MLPSELMMPAKTPPIIASRVVRETEKVMREYERYLQGEHVTMTINNNLRILLGCPFVSDGEFIVDHVVNDPDDVRRCLPKLLSVLINFENERDSIISLVSGLVRNHCWGECLQTESDAYALAAALVYFTEARQHKLMETEVVTDVRAIFNAWLRPASASVRLPDVETLCLHLFGSAWCSVVLPASEKLRALILTQRPPFLPGLCPAQDAILSVPLPDDLGPAT
jgi:hypothetical protein